MTVDAAIAETVRQVVREEIRAILGEPKLPTKMDRRRSNRGVFCAACRWNPPRNQGTARFLHVHHIIPRSAGGSDDPSNLVQLCPTCHVVAHRILYRNNGLNKPPTTRENLLLRLDLVYRVT